MAETGIAWRSYWVLEKRRGNWSDEDIVSGRAPLPYESRGDAGNTIVWKGSSCIWELFIGTGNVTEFDNANAHIGVGDLSDWQGFAATDFIATNKAKRPMLSGYPVVGSEGLVTFRASFPDGVAEFFWNQAGIFNADTFGSGDMLNIRESAYGTKPADVTWTFEIRVRMSGGEFGLLNAT